MGILEKLRPQPRWKHADPAVRAAAVYELGPDDGDALRMLAREDSEARVRRAAVTRLDDISLLGEIAKTDFVAVLAHPRDENGPRGIVAAIARTELASLAILQEAKKKLPAYMVPQRVLLLEDLPLNANGKFDKKRLLEMFMDIDRANAPSA